MRYIGYVFLLFLSLGLIYFLLTFYSSQQRVKGQVIINNKQFEVEFAIHKDEKANGLSNKEFLAEDEGMLFIYHGQKPSFWMKNMKFPLDIIWIDRRKKIIEITSDVRPDGDRPAAIISPTAPIGYVLEINGGLAKKLDIKPGDTMEIKL